MKNKLSQLSLLLLSFIALTSCSDSLEKLTEDQIEYMEEITEIINKTADGDLSSSEAAEEIRDWGEKGSELKDRAIALREEMSEEELEIEAKKLAEDYGERQMKAFTNYMQAVKRLEKSGRMTQEITDAIQQTN